LKKKLKDKQDFYSKVLLYDNEDLTINRAASVIKKTRANFSVTIDQYLLFLIFRNSMDLDNTNTLCCYQSEFEIFKTIVEYNA